LSKFVDAVIDKEKVTQKKTWDLTFKVWAVLGPILTAIVAYLTARG
jgi:hypothetical protein